MISTSSHAMTNVAQPSRSLPTTTSRNPLSDLIHTEKTYVETLRIIDSQIAPIWMKQMVSAAPDFSELLKYTHHILKVNKRFYSKLVKVASNQKAMKELGDVLMQWIEDMEIPYANFARSSIPNLDKRPEITNNVSIRHLLENLSANVNDNITLGLLFEAPLKRLHYYKALYHRLLECTKPGRADHQLLLRANQRIDALINISPNEASLSSSNDVSSSNSIHDSHRQQVRLKLQQRQEMKQRLEEQNKGQDIPSIECDPNTLTAFVDQIDCSHVLDFFSRTRIRFKLQWKAPDVQLIMQDSFVMLPQHKNESSVHVRIALTTSELAICEELGQERKHPYALMFPPLAVHQLSVRSLSLERELVGEYLLQFTVHGTHHIVMKANSREVRNAWVGVSASTPSASTLKPKSLITTVKQRVLQLQQEISTKKATLSHHGNSRATEATMFSTVSSIATRDDIDDDTHSTNMQNTDVYALYDVDSDDKQNNNGHDNEENRGDELPQARRKAFRDTIMDFYDGRFTESDEDDKVGTSHSQRTEQPPLPPLFSKPVISENTKNKRHDPVLDSDGQDLANIQPRSIKIIPKLPDIDDFKKSSSVEDLSSAPTTPPTAVQRAPPMPPVPVNSNDEKKQEKKDEMEVAPVQMTFIEPEAHKMNLSSTSITIEDDDDDDGDDLPLAQSKERSANDTSPTTPSSSTENIKVPSQSSMLARSSSRGGALTKNNPSPNPSLNNGPPQQQYGGGNTSPTNGLRSVRAALAASVDSFAESTKSSPSDYSLTRGSSSTMATDRGSPPSSIEQVKPQTPVTPPPRKGSMPEHPQQPMLSNSSSTNNSLHQPYPAPAQSSSTPVPQQAQNSSHQLPARLDSHKAPSNSLEDLASPPPSPGAYANAVRQILYSHGRCEVFHWKDQTWFSAQEPCAIRVHTTNANRSCLSIQLLQSRQLYLNAWIVPTTVVEQQGASDVSVSLFMGEKKENYLIHFDRRSDAVELTSVLQRVHFESQQMFGPIPTGPPTAGAGMGGGLGPGLTRGGSQRSIATAQTAPSLHSSPSVLHSVSLFDAPMPTDARSYLEEVPQTLSPLIQCKVKLFYQQEPSNWNNMGGAVLRIAQQMPSKKTHVCIENGKHRLVSALIMSSNVQQINPKRISFLLHNDQTKTHGVYMVQVKDEKTATKVFEYLRTRNQQNGW
ncbi:hypothetical protein BDA99DRAFT_536516 [Phascolomyces articulosus]|uniref:DH domain-containing protein n=1 Tax=Phascolomyces articulosus TaxID=60185 RepID=A0AAD5K1U7_9FUNG|nr:hypothetical protein BDA99DRAFT_536516 [Phascolomyces articulosus]